MMLDDSSPEAEESGGAEPQAAGAARPAYVMRKTRGRLGRLCLKELRETLRDRRTIITLVLMPLLVYPLLSVVINRFLLTSVGGKQQPIRIGVLSAEAYGQLEEYLQIGDRLLREKATASGDVADEAGAADPLGAAKALGETLRQGAGENAPTAPRDEPKVEWLAGEEPGEGNLRDSVRAGAVDLGILIDSARPLPDLPRPSLQLRLIYQAASPNSKRALSYVQQRLEAINQWSVRKRLADAGLSTEMLAEVTLEGSLPATGGSAFSLAAFVPLVLILMTITGAVYPAIDVTAGERERGTMEMVIAAPVPRLHLLLAKYVAVLTVALLTALANLTAMLITLSSTGIAKAIFGGEGFSALTMLKILALLLLFAAFFSALLLAITSFARSFKEAQAYLIPLMLLALGPGVVSLLPGLELRGWLAVTPLLNIVLLGRDVLEGVALDMNAVVAVISNLLYAVAAIAVAARIFGTDAILYDSQASWSDWLRQPHRRDQPPTTASAMLCLACMFPAYFWASSLLGQFQSLDMQTRLFMAGAITVLLFGGIPWVAAKLSGIRLKDAFALKAPTAGYLTAALVLGVSLWVWAHEIFLLNSWLGIRLPEDRIQAGLLLVGKFAEIPSWVIVLNLGLAPAVCEELFFRGYLLSSLRKLDAWKAILITSLLFGLFHVVTTSALHLERMLPSTFLGLILGWIAWKSRSVWPGMLLHAVHNSLLLLMAANYKQLESWLGASIAEQGHLPLLWLLAAGVVVAIGGVLLVRQAPVVAKETVESGAGA